MAQTAKSIILSKFEAGDRPTDQDFLNLFDSVLFINNVGSHLNGLNTANTSIEGNFTIQGDLSIGGSSTLSLASGDLSIGNAAELVNSPYHGYTDQDEPVMYASASISDVIFRGISGDSTSSIKLEDPTGFAQFGTHTGKAFISVVGHEYFNITSSNLGPHSFFSGSVGIGSVANTNAAEKFKILDADTNVTAHLQTSKTNGVASIGFQNDAQTYTFGVRGNDNLTIVNGSETPFKIKSNATTDNLVLDSGKVGIGTSSPSNPLHVESATDTIALFKTTDDGPTIIDVATNSADTDTHSAIHFLESTTVKGATGYNAENDTINLLYSTGINSTVTNGININSSGQVGIGTSSPSQLLHILDTVNDVSLQLESTKTNGQAFIRFVGDTGSPAQQHWRLGLTTTNAFTLYDNTGTTTPFTVEAGAGSNILFVGSTSNVGIGTNTPPEKLTVEGNISASGAINTLSHITASGNISASGNIIGNVISGSIISGGLLVGDGGGITNLPAAAISSYTNNGDNRVLTSVNASEVNAEANLIFDGTNLGIGITPTETLQVEGNISSSGVISTLSHITSSGNISASGDIFGFTGSFQGNVGIGTTTPNSKLSVVGNTVIRNTADNGNVMLFQNDNSVATKADILFDASGLITAEDSLFMAINSTGGSGTFDIRTGDPQGGGEGNNNTTKIASFTTGSNGGGLVLYGNEANNHPAQIQFGVPTLSALSGSDGARIKFSTVNSQGNFYDASSLDFLVFEKLDKNNAVPDGGILFTNTGFNDTDTGTETVAMSIRGNGDIGIGTAEPEKKLHLQSTEAEIAKFQSVTDDQQAFIEIDSSNVNNNSSAYVYFNQATAGKGAVGYRANTDTIALVYDTGIASNDGINISGSGVVGIGTSSPLAGVDLHINHNATSNAVLLLESDGFNSDSIVALRQAITAYPGTAGNGGTGVDLAYDGADDKFYIKGYTNSSGFRGNSVSVDVDTPSDTLVLDEDGRVGVGVNVPAYGFDYRLPSSNNISNHAYLGITNLVHQDSASGVLYRNGGGIKGFSGYFNDEMRLVAGTGPATTKGISIETGDGTVKIGNVTTGTRFLEFGTNSNGVRKITDQEGLAFGCDSSLVLHAGDHLSSDLDTLLNIPSNSTSENIHLYSDGSVFITTDGQGGVVADHHHFGFYPTGQFAINRKDTNNFHSSSASPARGNGAEPAIYIKSRHEGDSDGGDHLGTYGGGIRFEDNNTTNYFDLAYINDHLYFSYKDGGNTNADSVFAVIDNTYNETFTGQHLNLPSTGNVSDYNDKIGYIVVSTGIYNNVNSNHVEVTTPTINEALPKVKLSDRSNDKRVFGVISNVDDPNEGIRNEMRGNTISFITKLDDRLIINSLGEGAIMVSNINGNLENGDYITTSAIEGLGMKQDDDLLHNYTVAKITQDCDFSSDTTDVTHDGQTYKMKLVGCTYHCG